MTEIVVADAGPLIGLARTDYLWLLKNLYGRVLIPPAVKTELPLDATRAGSSALSQAMKSGWLLMAKPPPGQETARLTEILDAGEAEAIVLAQARRARLLIDERRGRAVAIRRGVTVIGTGAVLLAAQRANVVEHVSPILDQLGEQGYRVSDRIRKKLLSLAGED